MQEGISQNIIINVKQSNFPIIHDTTFVNLKDYSSDFFYDMKYASTDNFMKANVYGCGECLLRLKTVKALISANKAFILKGYKIKLFDCYRPLDIQKKMWKILHNPSYVANPSTGSIHNRGGAVDITLVDSNGKDLDMGTAFDFFGIKASHNFVNLSRSILANRRMLKEVMLQNKFKPQNSEWWHYNLESANEDKISNVKWNCE